MTSLAKLGTFLRLSWLADVGLMFLIVGGFMATTAAMFWSFTQPPDRPAYTVQQTVSDAPAELICECTLEQSPTTLN